MAKLRIRSSRTSPNIGKPEGADMQEYLLLAILILLVVGIVIAYSTHRLHP